MKVWEEDGSELTISSEIKQTISKRVEISELMQILCNRDTDWCTFASENQIKRLVTLANKAYDLGQDKVKPQNAEKYKSKKKGGPLIPIHEHLPEICKIYNCKFLENTMKSLLNNSAGFNEDLVQRFSTYLNRMLLSMTFNYNAPAYMRKKYNDYLNRLETDAKDQLNFYERQEVDLIVK